DRVILAAAIDHDAFVAERDGIQAIGDVVGLVLGDDDGAERRHWRASGHDGRTQTAVRVGRNITDCSHAAKPGMPTRIPTGPPRACPIPGAFWTLQARSGWAMTLGHPRTRLASALNHVFNAQTDMAKGRDRDPRSRGDDRRSHCERLFS